MAITLLTLVHDHTDLTDEWGEPLNNPINDGYDDYVLSDSRKMCEYGALTLDDDVYIPQADGTWRKYGDLWAVYREEQDVDPDLHACMRLRTIVPDEGEVDWIYERGKQWEEARTAAFDAEFGPDPIFG